MPGTQNSYVLYGTLAGFIVLFHPGDHIGKWIVLSRIGSGGMGSVYKCRSEFSERVVRAVKVLSVSDDEKKERRFVREMEALATMDHPAIVRALDIDRDERFNVLYITMELIEGQTLFRRLLRGPVPTGEAYQLIHQVASGLRYAHSAGFYHRDIKPDNIILSPSRGPVLVDFGVARHAGKHTMTPLNSFGGTPPYVPPEVFYRFVGQAEHFEAERPDGDVRARRWDVYSLGQLFCEMLTGSPTLPTDMSFGNIVRAKLDLPSLDPGEEEPPRLRWLIRSTTAPNPAHRIQTMDAFIERLEDPNLLVFGASIEDLPEPPPPPRRADTTYCGLEDDEEIEEEADAVAIVERSLLAQRRQRSGSNSLPEAIPSDETRPIPRMESPTLHRRVPTDQNAGAADETTVLGLRRNAPEGTTSTSDADTRLLPRKRDHHRHTGEDTDLSVSGASGWLLVLLGAVVVGGLPFVILAVLLWMGAGDMRTESDGYSLPDRSPSPAIIAPPPPDQPAEPAPSSAPSPSPSPLSVSQQASATSDTKAVAAAPLAPTSPSGECESGMTVVTPGMWRFTFLREGVSEQVQEHKILPGASVSFQCKPRRGKMFCNITTEESGMARATVSIAGDVDRAGMVGPDSQRCLRP